MTDPVGSRVIAVAGTSHSPMVTLDTYRIPAGTGIGLAFGLWA